MGIKINQLKICTKCQIEKNFREFYYHRRRKIYANSCKECNTEKSTEYQRLKRELKDVNFLFKERANGIKRDKKKLNIPVMEKLGNYLIFLWEKQNSKCYYTDVQMDVTGYKTNNHFAVTVDRIIPKLGYVENNIALCCSIVNRMKQDLTIEDLKLWCEKILKCNV